MISDAELQEKIKLITQMYVECQALMLNRQDKLENFESPENLKEHQTIPSTSTLDSKNDDNSNNETVAQNATNPEHTLEDRIEDRIEVKIQTEEKCDAKYWESADESDPRYSVQSIDSCNDSVQSSHTPLLREEETLSEKPDPNLVK